MIDLNNKKKDIRKFITVIENSIIKFLNLYKIKSKADNFKKLGVKCFPGNVLKRIFDDNKKISHFIVEVSFDHDKTPESHRWKFWKVPFGLTRRINHITNPVC